MADKYINATGLQIIKQWIEGKFATGESLDDLAERVEEIIAEGGEPNVIETVKVNGTALVPDANKAVDVEVPTVGSAQNTGGYVTYATHTSDLANKADTDDVPTKLSELTNDGDGTAGSAYATEDYVDENGGKIDKIKRNGVELQIDSTDKSVNILVTDTTATTSADGLMSSTDKSKLDGIEAEAQKNVQADWNQATTTADDFIKNKPTKLSDFTNDGDGTQGSAFATEDTVDEKISEQIGKVYQPKGSVTFANLPALSASVLSFVYNVTDAFTTTADFKEGAGKHYPAGTNVAIINDGTEQSPVYKYDALSGVVDLSDYWISTSGQPNTLEAMTVTEINNILNPTP